MNASSVAEAGGGRAVCVLWCHDARAASTTLVCSVTASAETPVLQGCVHQYWSGLVEHSSLQRAGIWD